MPRSLSPLPCLPAPHFPARTSLHTPDLLCGLRVQSQVPALACIGESERFGAGRNLGFQGEDLPVTVTAMSLRQLPHGIRLGLLGFGGTTCVTRTESDEQGPPQLGTDTPMKALCTNGTGARARRCMRHQLASPRALVRF